MGKKALASDIDGTLFFHDTEIFSEPSTTMEKGFKKEDLAAISAWQADGGLFGLCSGRPIAGILDLFPNGIEPDFYIACSGAVILDKNRNVIYEAAIDRNDIKELFEKYKGIYIFAAFHTDNQDRVYQTEHDGEDREKQVIVSSLEDVETSKFFGISLCFSDDETAGKICREVNENYPALEGFQNKNSVDIVSKGCSKGNGILRIKEYLQADIVAGIGDSFNDIPMFQTAYPSFTFHSSPEEIRNQVTYIVESVAEALGKLKKSETDFLQLHKIKGESALCN